MAVLILDSATAVAGAVEGVKLCLWTVIPGLFPFFVLSGVLTSCLPRGGLMMAGILGGYPVGARNAALALEAGQVSREEAERLALLYNCPGPAFLFGVAAQLFTPGRTVMLWGVYLASVGILRLLLPGKVTVSPSRAPMGLNEAMTGAIRSMAGVCGWVVLMRTVLAVLDRWVLWLLPDWGRAMVCGILELTNGILLLRDTHEPLRFVMAAGFLGFGGICVMLQTMGVARRLSLKLYFPGKVFQSCVCICLAAAVNRAVLPLPCWLILTATCILSVWKLRKNQNNYGNLRLIGV